MLRSLAQRALLVGAREPAIADDIGDQDRSNPRVGVFMGGGFQGGAAAWRRQLLLWNSGLAQTFEKRLNLS